MKYEQTYNILAGILWMGRGYY